MSTAFSVGASNALEYNAIIQDETALHIAISRESSASVSTQIAAIRRILFDAHIFATSTDYNQDAVNRVRKVSVFVDKSKSYTTYSYNYRVISRSSCILTMRTLWLRFFTSRPNTIASPVGAFVLHLLEQPKPTFLRIRLVTRV